MISKAIVQRPGVNYYKMFNAWMSDALKESAKTVIPAQAAHIRDFKSLNKTRNARQSVQSKMFQRVSDLKNLSMNKKVNQRTC